MADDEAMNLEQDGKHCLVGALTQRCFLFTHVL
jgi:hypothetical protein